MALLDHIAAREPLVVADGKSGTSMWKLRLEDGQRLVGKRVAPGGDWIQRVCEDDVCRAIRLWTDGIYQQVPAVIDHAVVGVEEEDAGWLLVMRDVSDHVFPDGRRITREESRRLVHAAATLHASFVDTTAPDWLCPLAVRYRMLGPTTAEREPDEVVPQLAAKGWARLAEVVPADVADAVHAVLQRPELLSDRLARYPQTLIQGDMKMGNMGLAPDAAVFLDWGTQTGYAPPAVEFAWYLAISGSSIDATRDDVLADCRVAAADLHDEDALRLALFGALCQLGWDKVLQITEGDAATSAREREDLAWWVSQARQALEVWSPV